MKGAVHGLARTLRFTADIVLGAAVGCILTIVGSKRRENPLGGH